VGNWYVSNAAMTLTTVLSTIPVLFLTVRAGKTYRTGAFCHVVRRDVQMYKSFSLKKTLYENSTVAQTAERLEPNTVLWPFHTIQPSSI